MKDDIVRVKTIAGLKSAVKELEDTDTLVLIGVKKAKTGTVSECVFQKRYTGDNRPFEHLQRKGVQKWVEEEQTSK